MSYESAKLSFSYEIDGYESSSLSFGYAIAASGIEEASLSFSYSIADTSITPYERLQTPIGYMTQVIGNQLPYWHAARRLEGGRSQRVINSLGGFHLTELMNQVRKFRKNQFLSTTDISDPSYLWATPRPVAKGNHETTRNLLFNGSLSYTHPYRLGPWGWCSSFSTDTGSYSVRPGKGLFGYYAVRLVADSDESITLTQTIDFVVRPQKEVTATVWYAGMRPERSPVVTYRGSGPKLQLTLLYNDGTSKTVSKYLYDDTAGSWKKASVTLSAEKEASDVQVAIVVTDYKGDTVTLDIGGVQLETGALSTQWTENFFDKETLYLVSARTSYTESTSWGDITYDRIQRVQIKDIFSWPEMLRDVPPDRASVSLATTEVGVSRETLNAYVDQSGNQFSMGWRIINNQVEVYNADINQSEVWYQADIWDAYADGKRDELLFDPGDLGVTQTLEAITTTEDWVYVIVKETYLGQTYRVLKICSPYLPWENIRLECIRDIYIDDGTGTCNSIGLVEGRKDMFILDIDSTDYLVELVWDSAAFSNNGIVLLRSNPGSAKLVS